MMGLINWQRLTYEFVVDSDMELILVATTSYDVVADNDVTEPLVHIIV